MDEERDSIYEESPEVADVAYDIINDHRTELQDANIAYFFRHGPWRSKGKNVLGQAKKVSGLYRELTGKDYVIVISADFWQQATEAQQKAIVHHELMHCGKNEDGSWVLHDHDFNGFNQELKLYGVWTGDLKQMDQQRRQISFLDQETTRAAG